ncbi:hypothetical protein [Flagellimonas hymeniacidonis]|nr:hypothetical protein [Flagellimonas hymeniacidonis]
MTYKTMSICSIERRIDGYKDGAVVLIFCFGKLKQEKQYSINQKGRDMNL